MKKAIFVIGPTATGKTSMGVSIARRIQSEIISIDSRQVYHGLDLGTGKDLADFGEGHTAVPYHLIDIADPKTVEYNLHQFMTDAKEAFESISAKGKTPIFVGGTSLYTNALLSGYVLDGCEPNPELRAKLEQWPTDELVNELKKYPDIYERTDLGNRKRVIRGIEIGQTPDRKPAATFPEIEPLLLAPYYTRKEVQRRIEIRLDQRLKEGMIDEVRHLHESGVSWEKLDWFGLEYRWISAHLKGELSFDEMREKLFIRIRQFAKSQDIWLRKMERESKVIHWIPNGNPAVAARLVNLYLNDQPLPEPEIKISETYYGPKSQ